MTIQYLISDFQVGALAQEFSQTEAHSDVVLENLSEQGIHVSGFEELRTKTKLQELGKYHYDELHCVVRRFSPVSVESQILEAQTRMRYLVEDGKNDELVECVERLPESVLWEVYADIYNVMMSFGVAREIFDRHFDAARPHSRVLDIGAGTGLIAVPKYQNGANVVAIEPEAAMRRRLVFFARSVSSPSALTIMPTHYTPELPIDGVFDHIVMRYVLYLLNDHETHLARTFDLLEAGGSLAISNPIPINSDSDEFRRFISDLRKEMGTLGLGWKEEIVGPINKRLAKHAHLISRSQLEDLLTRIGFIVEQAEDVRTGFFVKARKPHLPHRVN